MAGSDPFSGIRLSEQTSAGKLDQRLFTPDKLPAPSTPKPALPTQVEPPKKPVELPPPVPSASSSTQAPKIQSQPTPHFDLKDEPLYKASFLFTSEELEALEDLKLELRRQYDTKVTKNSLIRGALHMLLEDHATNGSRSYASRKIRKG